MELILILIALGLTVVLVALKIFNKSAKSKSSEPTASKAAEKVEKKEKPAEKPKKKFDIWKLPWGWILTGAFVAVVILAMRNQPNWQVYWAEHPASTQSSQVECAPMGLDPEGAQCQIDRPTVINVSAEARKKKFFPCFSPTFGRDDMHDYYLECPNPETRLWNPWDHEHACNNVSMFRATPNPGKGTVVISYKASMISCDPDAGKSKSNDDDEPIIIVE